MHDETMRDLRTQPEWCPLLCGGDCKLALTSPSSEQVAKRSGARRLCRVCIALVSTCKRPIIDATAVAAVTVASTRHRILSRRRARCGHSEIHLQRL